jgi:YbbR domain-containing protein
MWLSSIKVVLKKNENFKICVDFKNLNATTKKDPYPLSFIDEILNIVVGHDSYSFLDRYFGCHKYL